MSSKNIVLLGVLVEVRMEDCEVNIISVSSNGDALFACLASAHPGETAFEGADPR